MSDAMVVALITAGATVICQILIAISANGKTIWRIEQLEKKVEKHNTVIERTKDIELALVRVQERAKSNTHRLDEIETKI